MKLKIIFGLLAALLFLNIVYAHDGDVSNEGLRNAVDYSLKAVYITSIIMVIVTFLSIYYYKKLKSWHKSLAFWMITIPVLATTIGIVGSTIYLNIVSPTHGPVHWHADFEVIICGKDYMTKDPSGLSGKVGIPILHEHNDMRIHVEGTPLDLRDLDLTSFFIAIGGDLSIDRLMFPSTEGMISVANGQQCNGKPGRLIIFVEKQVGKDREWMIAENMGEYILAGYSTIPPGDRIKIIFTEKNEHDTLNDIIGGRL